MKLSFKAGDFEIETWTDGYPRWMELKHGGETLKRFHHDELRDLIFILERMRANARATIGENYRHEFD